MADGRVTSLAGVIAPLLLVISAVLGIVGTSSDASAHTFTQADGNDSPGHLDLRSVTVEHMNKNASLVFTFTTYNRWKANADLNDSLFLIAIDHAGDGTPDRCAFIYYYGGLRGELTNCGRKGLSALKVSKPSRTKARMILPGEIRSHYWFAGSYWKGKDCKKGCWDYAPNKKWLFHDLVPPVVTWNTTNLVPGNPSTSLSLTTTVPVEFTATDSETGVASWLIKSGSDVLASGTGTGTIDHDLQLEEGHRYGLVASALDQQDNVGSTSAINPLWIVVPYDDANAAATYSAGWSAVLDSTSFLGTAHSTTTAGASMSFTFTTTSGGLVYVIGGPGDGLAMLSDGVTSIPISEGPDTTNGAALGTGLYAAGPGTHHVTLTVSSGTIVLDGIEVNGS